MSATAPTDNHGLVRPWERNRSFVLESRSPSPSLAHLVDRHWRVRWNLPDCCPFQQEVLPHPSINIVLDPQGARVWGVPTRRDARLLHGRGWAMGTKFQPGAFTAITGISAATLTDRSAPIPHCLGGLLDPNLFTSSDQPHWDAAAAEIEERLASSTKLHDPALELVGAVIHRMRELDPNARVEEIAATHSIAPRTLQRLFQRYVGVSPKWVLKRLRIHQAVERLGEPLAVPWTTLALELGYYDHAHFIRDFRLVVGRSPADYVSEMRLAHST
jgi:AraC-like DNA-binding protein